MKINDIFTDVGIGYLKDLNVQWIEVDGKLLKNPNYRRPNDRAENNEAPEAKE